MKKYIAFFTVILALGLSAQKPSVKTKEVVEERQRTMQILLNPIASGLGSIWATYELKVSNGISLRIPLNVHLNSKDQEIPKLLPIPSNISVGIGAKFFFSGKVFESGWYIYPEILGGFSWGQGADGYTMTAQVMIGRGWVFENGFSVNLGVGYYYNRDFSVVKSVYNTPNGMVNAEFALGYAW